MTTHIKLPPDELIDCWTFVREIARITVPDLNPNATGVECIVAKKPTPLGVAGIGDVQFVEQDLTDDDRRYLLRVLPDLPELRIPYSDDVVGAFLKAYRALPDRPNWEPVVLTESRYLQEYDRLIGLRWQASSDHLQVLQHWLDTDRIKAFRRKHVPATELLVETLIPRLDVQRYLDYCEIAYSGEVSTESTPPDTGIAETKSALGEVTSAGTHASESDSPSPSAPSAGNKVQPSVADPKPVGPPGFQSAAVPQGPLLDIKEVSERTAISVSMLHERMREGSKYYDRDFPEKINLGERTVRYSQTAVDAWIQQRLSATKK